MESVVCETLVCPQTEIRYGDILEHLNNLSISKDSSDSKYLISKCLNKKPEINPQKKNNSEKFIFDDKKIVENLSSSIKNKELLKVVVQADVESVFCKPSNKNCEINSNKKNFTESSSLEGNYKIIESQFSSLSLKNNKLLNKSYEGCSDVPASLSLKNNKLLNKSYEGCSDVSAGDESDSDNDEQVPTLRGRDPTRHNRPENNKQSRTTPFSRNHRRASGPQINSNNFQTFGDFNPNIFNNFPSNDGYTFNHINTVDVERFSFASSPSRSFHSDFHTSELMTDEAFESVVSNTMVPFDHFGPVVENQIVDFANPNAVTDEAFDSLVPSAVDDIGNLNDEFSAEIHNFLYRDNLAGNTFEPNNTGCAVFNIDEETSLDSYFEDLTAEEAVDILRHLTDSREDQFSNHNRRHLNLIEESPMHILSGIEVENELNNSFALNQNNSFGSSFDEIGDQMNNLQSLYPEPGYMHLEANIGETSLYSEGQNVSTSHPGTEISWNELPFVGLDNNSFSDFLNTSEDESSDERNDSKPACKTKIKICWKLGREARDRLFHSPSFSVCQYEYEIKAIRQQIESGKLGTKDKKVIHMLKKNRKTKYRGSNLHYAILSKNVEKVYCLVECHKECHDGISEINLVDNDNKTVLDYSIDFRMDLLSAYLVENLAKRWTKVG